MKRRTEKLLRKILLFVDQQIDELSTQESFAEGDPSFESTSTPIGRVRAKLDELALAIEFELQLQSTKTPKVRSNLTSEALEETATSHIQEGRDAGEMPAVADQNLSAFQKFVDQWFLDHPNIEDDDADKHPLARRFTAL